MRGFDHATILTPSFHGVHKEHLAQWPAFCVPKKGPKIPGGYFQKNWVGVCCTLPETLTLFHTKICDFSYPISDLIKNLIPRPEALEPGAWPEPATSCYGTYTVVAVNIKREMVLSPNDEEVANSSKKHTQFKTRVHKPYPISDQNGRNSDQTLPFGAAHTDIAYIKDYPPPPGAKNVLQIMNLAAYASETNNAFWLVESCDAYRLKGVFCSRRQLLFQILSNSSKKRWCLTARQTKLASTDEFDVIIVELQTSHEYCLQFADHLSPNYVM